ncbi:hypothetical protein KY342_04125, partial [Candidatus Woesearchaeota archaeon]|nr:hypothetical protein [Candidatus Woesearchaeota archaeon]
ELKQLKRDLKKGGMITLSSEYINEELSNLKKLRSKIIPLSKLHEEITDYLCYNDAEGLFDFLDEEAENENNSRKFRDQVKELRDRYTGPWKVYNKVTSFDPQNLILYLNGMKFLRTQEKEEFNKLYEIIRDANEEVSFELSLKDKANLFPFFGYSNTVIEYTPKVKEGINYGVQNVELYFATVWDNTHYETSKHFDIPQVIEDVNIGNAVSNLNLYYTVFGHPGIYVPGCRCCDKVEDILEAKKKQKLEKQSTWSDRHLS